MAANRKLTLDCSYSGLCGGCDYPTDTYQKQLERKIKHLSATTGWQTQQLNVVASPRALNYRHRVLLRARFDAAGWLKIGYFQKNTRSFVPISGCKVASFVINRYLNHCLSLRSEALANKRFRLRLEDYRSGLMVLIEPVEFNCDQRHTLKGLLGQPLLEGWVGFSSESITADFQLYDRGELNIAFYTRPGLFQQINPYVNHKLRQIINAIFKDYDIKSCADFYAGSGNLSLELASSGIRVYGFEMNQTACKAARFALKSNSINLASYECLDLSKNKELGIKFVEAVLIDPPKKGVDQKLLNNISQLKPRLITACYCNPKIVDSEINKIESCGFKLQQLYLLDMFPFTAAYETLAVFCQNR